VSFIPSLCNKKENKKMSYRLMFTINAVALAIFGVFIMIMPKFVLTQFGSDVYAQSLFVAQFFGGALLLSGLFLWILKDSVSAKMQKNIGYLLLAYSIGGFAMGLYGMASIRVLRTNGWVLLVVFGLFALIYGYMLFLQPKPAPARASNPRKAKDAPSSKAKEFPPTNDGQPT
jgi:uncharacterized membrane protein HdeD (DUF308 family)